ncbi:AraC family transcriptional regulator [uncultured Tenacibaculum sp.]|uniref:AraC family transcriptional regulator n=1 Tax=uncultured Tenacibaculum sp. TaxID=174713 RepID=UPI0026084B28|nr:AraC family transcriptional regulator [uncultured Tenacibaculum sp.]
MKAINEQLFYSNQQSFLVSEFKQNYFDSPWHFHHEYELTYIESGHGTRFVGTSAESFTEGDLVLIGPQLPHYWRCDSIFYQQEDLISKSQVIQFKDDLFFANELPEMKNIHSLLKKSASGIQFINGKKYEAEITNLGKLTGISRLLSLYEILEKLSLDNNQKLLSTTESSQFYQAKDSATFQKILNYIFDNLEQEISLDSISKKVFMSKSSFCKYFKKRTKTTFTDYVNKLRITKAARLLSESDLTVSEICFASGFNSLSYFNRQFQKQKKISPKAYSKLYNNKK